MQMDPTTPQALAALRRDAGMQRVSDAVDRATPGWREQALDSIRRFAAMRSDAFTTEDMRVALSAQLPGQERLRVWGPLTKTALKAGYLVATDRFAPTASSNGSPRRMYRRGPNA